MVSLLKFQVEELLPCLHPRKVYIYDDMRG